MSLPPALPTLPPSTFTAIPDAQSYVNGFVDKYVLRTKSSNGIGGFLFDYLGDETLTLQADITDHFNEKNVAIQDHIAIRPTRLVLRGFVSELVFQAPHGVTGLLSSVSSALSQVDAYLESYTPGVVQTLVKAVNQVTNVVNTINRDLAKAQNIISLLPGAPPTITRQEQAYTQLSNAFITKQILQVATPFAVYDNMVIEQLVFIQPEDSKTVADISVTLKHIRFVEVQVVANDGTYAGRAAYMNSTATAKGTGSGSPIESTSVISTLTGIGAKP